MNGPNINFIDNYDLMGDRNASLKTVEELMNHNKTSNVQAIDKQANTLDSQQVELDVDGC